MAASSSDWAERIKIKLRKLLIFLEMASLQSSRTQCCCCAIGVFAAMFGVFMLSAGICIVVNVGMEVDTSGLPSNLHNDDGREIVGIILICVAVATLALSASVGFFYFVVCNRKPHQHPSPAAVAAARRSDGQSGAGPGDVLHGKHRHHGHHHGHHHHHHSAAGRGVNGVLQQQRAGGSSSPADGRSARLAQPERTRSRDSLRSGSQQSLRSAVAGALGDGPGGSGTRPSGRPSGSRYHAKRSHKSRVIRYKSGLEPHQEEDVEAAKSVVDLKRTLSSGSATAGLPHSADSKRVHSNQAWDESTDQDKTRSGRNPPTIVLSNAVDHQLGSETMEDSSSVFNNSINTMETQLLVESGSMTMLGDTFNSTAELASQDSTLNEEYQQRRLSGGVAELGESQGRNTSSTSGAVSPLSAEELPQPDSTTKPVESTGTQAAGQTSSAVAKHSVSPMSSSSSTSVSSHSSSANLIGDGSGPFHKEPSDRGGGNAERNSEQRHRKHKRRHHRSHRDKSSEFGDTDIQLNRLHANQAARQDPIPNVTSRSSSSPQQPIAVENPVPEVPDSGSDNHAFSYDGEDPDPDETDDLHKMQEYMKELMEESEDV